MGSQEDSIFRILDKILKKLKVIEATLHVMPETVDVLWIATEMGCSRSHLYASRWYLPYFGNSQYIGSPSKWDREIWDAWRKLPVNERRKAWESKDTDRFLQKYESILSH